MFRHFVLQHQLEDNFYHNQPASLKRTVDFVADRVASKYIKQFRVSALPEALQTGCQRAREIANQLLVSSPDGRLRVGIHIYMYIYIAFVV